MREKRELNETELENAVGGVNWELFSNCLVDNSAENDPELAERLYNVVLEFNRPVFRKKRPTIGRGSEEEKK